MYMCIYIHIYIYIHICVYTIYTYTPPLWLTALQACTLSVVGVFNWASKPGQFTPKAKN